MSPKPALQPICLDAKGNGLLHLPPPHPPFQISTQTLCLASPFLADLYSTSNHVYVSKADDPEAVRILLGIFHFVEPEFPEEAVTPDNVAKIAQLCLKWKCGKSLGPYPRLWLAILEKNSEGRHEPWNCWMDIGRAFGRDDIVNSIMLKDGRQAWKGMGYDELEGLRGAIAVDIIDELQTQRIDAISYIGRKTGEYLNMLYKIPTFCKASPLGRKRECDSILLGSLLRLFLESVLQPIPRRPFGSITVKDLLGDLGIQKPAIIGISNHPECKAAAVTFQMKLSNDANNFVATLDKEIDSLFTNRSIRVQMAVKSLSTTSNFEELEQKETKLTGKPTSEQESKLAKSGDFQAMKGTLDLVNSVPASEIPGSDGDEEEALANEDKFPEDLRSTEFRQLGSDNPGKIDPVGEFRREEELESFGKVLPPQKSGEVNTQPGFNHGPEVATNDRLRQEAKSTRDLQSTDEPKITGGKITEEVEEVKVNETEDTKKVEAVVEPSDIIAVAGGLVEVDLVGTSFTKEQPSGKESGIEAIEKALPVGIENSAAGVTPAGDVTTVESVDSMVEERVVPAVEVEKLKVLQKVASAEVEQLKALPSAQPAEKVHPMEEVQSLESKQSEYKASVIKLVSAPNPIHLEERAPLGDPINVKPIPTQTLRWKRFPGPNNENAPPRREFNLHVRTDSQETLTGSRMQLPATLNLTTPGPNPYIMPPSPAITNLISANWTVEERQRMMTSLQHPEKKGIFRYLRNKYREVHASFILHTVFKEDWNLATAETAIIAMRKLTREQSVFREINI